jgi:hypothetical protein
MAGPFLGKFPNPVFDISSGMDAIAGDPALVVDNYTQQLLSSLHGVRQLGKMFVIGFIPPDITTNFVSFEQKNRTISTVFGGGVSPSKGKDNSSVNELKKTGTKINELDLGSAYYTSLKSRGYTDDQAKRMAPVLVGISGAESIKKGNDLYTNNYNLANTLVGTPGSGIGIDPVPPNGGTYISGIITDKNGEKQSCYYAASDSLQDAADKHVDVLISSGLTPETQNDIYLVRIARPDLDDPFTFNAQNYNAKIGVGADSYSTSLNSSGKPIDSFTPGSDSKFIGLGIGIMGSAEVTDEEGQDPLNRSGRNVRALNNRRQAAAQAQVQFIEQQVSYIQSIPPLAMVVGPSDFTRSYSPTVDVPKARSGNIVHMWMEKPISIKASGSTAVQYAFDSQGNGGVTHQNRIYSLSYKNMMSLVRIYRNNGYIYAGSGAFGQGNDGIPLFAMSTYIYHDGRIYIGSFDDFTVTDSADNPHNMEYSFSFSVRYEVEASDATSGGGFL